jgi:hypothetical protein
MKCEQTLINGRLNDNRINTEHIMNAANPFTRRRFIGITAAVAAVAAVPWAARSTGRLNAAAEGIAPVTWRGIALGADAQMRLYHPDRHFALR